MTPPRAVIYARISRDREGAGLGVDRQVAECRELAARKGFTVVMQYTDNDLSAYSGKPRPGYRALLDDMRHGRVDVVLGWHTDRLHRSPVELEEYITASELHGVPTETVKAGMLDLSTPSGRLVARQLGAVARYEVEHAIERQRSAKDQAAVAGKFKGGRRPYGYEADGVTVRQAEADEVLRMSREFLAGTSIRSLTNDANARGLTTSTGVPWRQDAVRGLLLRPRNAGLMEHRGNVIGQAGWPAIVPEPTWRAVVAKLTDADRRTNTPNTARRWLGSGLFLCGTCGGPMRGQPPRMSRGKQVPALYICPSAHVARRVSDVDAYVREVVVARLSRADARNLLAPDPDGVDLVALSERASALQVEKDRLARLLVEGVLSEAGVRAESARLTAELNTIQAQMASVGETSALDVLIGADDVAACWDGLSLDRKRRVVDLLMTVTCLRSPKGRPPGWVPGSTYFKPETVAIEPKRRPQ